MAKSSNPDGKGPSYSPVDGPEDPRAEDDTPEEAEEKMDEAKEAAATSDPESGYAPENYDQAPQTVSGAGAVVGDPKSVSQDPQLGAVLARRAFQPEYGVARGTRLTDDQIEGMSSAELRAVAHDRGYDVGTSVGTQSIRARFRQAQEADDNLYDAEE